MVEKENVYEETATAGESATAQEHAEREERGKEVAPIAGKFKSVDALAKAYESLQAEFTRRSQRLKELERIAENSDAEGKAAQGKKAVEKLRKNAEVARAEEREFDRFIADVESAGARTLPQDTQADEPVSEVRMQEGTAVEKEKSLSLAELEESAQKEVLALGGGEAQGGENMEKSVAKGCESAELTEAELIKRVQENEGVRLKIIGEYLTSIGKAAVPLMRGGAGTLAAPPMKARSLEEAGSMALRLFKKEGMQA